MATPRPQRSTILILGLIATILVGWVLHVGAAIIQPLVIALLLASMLQPVVAWGAKRHVPAPITVLVIVSGLFFVLLQAGLLIQSNVSAFLRQAAEEQAQAAREEAPAPPQELAQADPLGEEQKPADGEVPEQDPAAAEGPGPLQGILDRQQVAIEEAGGWSGIKAGIRARIEAAEQLPEEMRKYALKAWDEFDPGNLAESVALTSAGFVRDLVIVLIYMVFIFAESAIFRKKIMTIAGERQGDAAEMLDRIGRGIQRYLGVKTAVSFLTGSLCYLALVALDIPYALLFGFFTFALNYIPTFGSIVAGIFPTLTALAVEESWLKAVLVVVAYLAVNLTLGSFIEPRILGRELNLSPLVVVISVVVWAGLWGVVGGFLAVPLTAALQITLASNDTTYPIAVMLGSGPGRRGEPAEAG